MNKKVFIAAISLIPSVAQAEPQAFTGYVGLGVAAVPDYEGSSDHQIIPIAAGRVNYDKYYVETTGLGLRGNISTAEWVEFGPSVALNLGRNNVDNRRVDAMHDIDSTIEGGGFIKIPFRKLVTPNDELALRVELLTDMGNIHDGTTISFGSSYSYAPSPKLRLGFGAAATYADSNYNDAFYSVNSSDSASSGLPVYKARSGIKDIGLNANATYMLDERWGIMGLASYKRLTGDAADSPIVEREGSANQTIFGTGISYVF